MAIDNESIIGAEYLARSSWLPYFQSRRCDKGWLLTNRVGDWYIVSEEEYNTLHHPYTPKSLISRLSKRRLVIDRSNETKLLDAWKRYNQGFYEGPYLHIIHLTQRCNLGCNYCHSSAIPLDAKGRDLTPEVAERIVKFISRVPSQRISINFQGGEPTLMPELLEYILDNATRLCRDHGKRLSFSITTNGTLINERLLRLLDQYKVSITVSVDGPQHVHDNIRTNRDSSGSYQDVMSGRELIIKEAADLLSGSILVLTKHSLPHLSDIIDEYHRLGTSLLHLKPVTRLGRGLSVWDDVSMTFEEYWEAYERAISYMQDLQSKNIYICELYLYLALKKILEGQDTTYVDFRNPCGVGYGVLNYDLDGKIYACHEGKRKKQFLLGNVDMTPLEILRSAETLNISGASVLDRHETCRTCTYLPYCAPCPANTFQHTGSYDIVPHEDFHCRFTLALYDMIFHKLNSEPEALLSWWRYFYMRSLKN